MLSFVLIKSQSFSLYIQFSFILRSLTCTLSCDTDLVKLVDRRLDPLVPPWTVRLCQNLLPSFALSVCFSLWTHIYMLCFKSIRESQSILVGVKSIALKYLKCVHKTEVAIFLRHMWKTFRHGLIYKKWMVLWCHSMLCSPISRPFPLFRQKCWGYPST